jgi:hypothetical protein
MASVNSLPFVLNVQELSVMLASRQLTPHVRLNMVIMKNSRMKGCYEDDTVREEYPLVAIMGNTIVLDYNFKIECYPPENKSPLFLQKHQDSLILAPC